MFFFRAVSWLREIQSLDFISVVVYKAIGSSLAKAKKGDKVTEDW